MESFTRWFDKAMQWGALYRPNNSVQSTPHVVLNIMLIGSAFPGYLMLRDLLKAVMVQPEKLRIVGLVTDDPSDPNAKISLRKRMWKEYTADERKELWLMGRDLALENGIPVYSGAVKQPVFRQILHAWNPNLILVNGLGQKLDAPIIDFPRYGAFNFHPSELSKQIGAGPNPYQQVVDLGLPDARMTVHRVSLNMDEGQIIGVSPLIRVIGPTGGYPSLLAMHDKITSLSGWMALLLCREIYKSRLSNEVFESIDFEDLSSEGLRRLLREPLEETRCRDLPASYSNELIDFSDID